MVYDYNSYKHGLTVYTMHKDISIYGPNSHKITEKGDALIFINKVEKPERFVWRKNTLFTPLDYRAVIIHMIQSLIFNIISVGKKTYLSKPHSTIRFISNNKPDQYYKPVKTKNKFGIAIDSYSVDLTYNKSTE